MKRQISFKQMHKNTEGLEERINEITQKFEKYFEGKVDLKWTCSKHGNFFEVEVKCNAPHFNKHASARSESFDKSCEMAIEKLDKQLKKFKELFSNKIHRGIARPLVLDPEVAWMEYDEDFYQDVG